MSKVTKKLSISSSPANEPLDSRVHYSRTLPKFTTCPDCGRKAIERVKSDYLTEDGASIPDLEHWQCASCGARFFDIEAMHRIVSEGRSRRSRRLTTQLAAEKNHA